MVRSKATETRLILTCDSSTNDYLPLHGELDFDNIGMMDNFIHAFIT